MKNLNTSIFVSPSAQSRHAVLRPIVQALFMCGLIGTVHAQQTLQSARERTRQTIEAVRAEQPGSLDGARGFGTTLDEDTARERADLWRDRSSSAQAAAKAPGSQAASSPAPAAANYLQQIQWPEPRPTGARRVAKRPAPAGSEDSSRINYTPDFTRQRLTLAVLAGRPLIDLPQEEVADLNPRVSPRRVEVRPADAVSLPDLVNIGLSYSPVMDQVTSQLDAAINRSRQARSDLLPRLSVRYSEGQEKSTGVNVQPNGTNNHTTSSEALRLTQPVFNLPLISDWLAELSNERAANWRMQAARESVALAVTQATLNVAAARMVVEHSDEQLANFSRLLDYVQARAQTGAASAADLERTRTRVLLARQTRLEQQANYKSALLELQRLTGQMPVALNLPFLNQLPGLPATQGEIRRLVWAQNHDLRALRSDIEAQRRTLASNDQRLLPVVGLSVEQDSSRNVRGENARQTDQRVMGVMTWDLSLGGREIYASRAAASELNNREAKLTEQGERVMQQVDADFAILQSVTLRVAAGQAEQAASAAVVASVDEQLRIGRIGSLLEALDAYERHFGARQRLTQTLVQQMQVQAQLLARMGVLSDLRQTAGIDLAPKSATMEGAANAAPAERAPVQGQGAGSSPAVKASPAPEQARPLVEIEPKAINPQPQPAVSQIKPQAAVAPQETKPAPSAAPPQAKPQAAAALSADRPAADKLLQDAKPQAAAELIQSKPQAAAAPQETKPAPSAMPPAAATASTDKPAAESQPQDAKPQAATESAQSKPEAAAAPAQVAVPAAALPQTASPADGRTSSGN